MMQPVHLCKKMRDAINEKTIREDDLYISYTEEVITRYMEGTCIKCGINSHHTCEYEFNFDHIRTIAPKYYCQVQIRNKITKEYIKTVIDHHIPLNENQEYVYPFKIIRIINNLPKDHIKTRFGILAPIGVVT
jgi:hypothetical protein